jgi:Ca2+/H+ antiporter, TMEM165/GDT1 family
MSKPETAKSLPHDVRLFGITLLAIFVAELGDKTQLTALTFTANAPDLRWMIFAGAAAAMTLTSLVGVLLGDLLARRIKPRVLNTVAGIIFLVCAAAFALKVLVGVGDSEGPRAVLSGSTESPWSAMAITFGAIFVAELGDKTQLATLSLAAGNRHARWIVFAGSALALVAASALACLVGGWVGGFIEGPWLTGAAAGLFAVLGVVFLWGRAEKGRREFAWLAGEIEKRYAEDERCRTCRRFMTFLDHIRQIGSETISAKAGELMLPRPQWRTPPEECRQCRIDALHRRWHQEYEHEDSNPLDEENKA